MARAPPTLRVGAAAGAEGVTVPQPALRCVTEHTADSAVLTIAGPTLDFIIAPATAPSSSTIAR